MQGPKSSTVAFVLENKLETVVWAVSIFHLLRHRSDTSSALLFRSWKGLGWVLSSSMKHLPSLLRFKLTMKSSMVSFMVRPFSLALRLFVAMTAGHILLKVLAGFIINSTAAGAGIGVLVSVPSFALMIGVSALEMLVAGVQAYVFALLTSLYINDAVHLHDHH